MHQHLLSIVDLADEDLWHLVERGSWYARLGVAPPQPLAGAVVGSYFRKTSTRTRTAFAAAALRLGAGHVQYGPADLQLNTGESLGDTAKVLGRMLDVLVVRTAGDPRELRILAGQRRMAVVNAMTAEEHPTQALADLTTLARRFGTLEGLRILYVGEGNNTAAALALALTRYRDVELWLATPSGYGLDPLILEEAGRQAKQHDAFVAECHELTNIPPGLDVVYTTRWQTTGTAKCDPGWRRDFAPFRVDQALMSCHPEAVFMHDLPAHRGEEVSAGVLDGPASLAFEQAATKVHSAMAVLEWTLWGRLG